MDIYDELGVRKVINGYATLTRLGGSLMPPVVIEAMTEAAKHFVDIDELAKKVGGKIAELTRNEAAYVCCGAAAGLAITTAACISGHDSAKRTQLPYTDGMKNEILIHKRNRSGYDYAIKQAGGEIVEFGSDQTTPEDLEKAINDKTAAIFYFYNITNYGGLVPIEKAVEMTRGRNIPVIVDAAAQIPPAKNLWKFTVDMGADLSIFSGGKGLCGPQSAGLILGRKDLIEICMLNACPRVSIGRGMKVGKEEMVGMLAAVKWYLSLDSKKLMQEYEDQVQYMIDECSKLPHTTARRNFPSEAGQPMPRAEIIFDEKKLGKTRDEILKQLRDGEPCIELAGAGPGSIFYNPQTIVPGEEKIIAKRIKEIVGC